MGAAVQNVRLFHQPFGVDGERVDLRLPAVRHRGTGESLHAPVASEDPLALRYLSHVFREPDGAEETHVQSPAVAAAAVATVIAAAVALVILKRKTRRQPCSSPSWIWPTMKPMSTWRTTVSPVPSLLPIPRSAQSRMPTSASTNRIWRRAIPIRRTRSA